MFIHLIGTNANLHTTTFRKQIPLSAVFGFDFVWAFLILYEAHSVIECRISYSCERLASEEALMRRYHHVRKRKETGGDGAFEYLLGTIFEYVVSFLLIYVKPNAEKPVCADALDKVLCVDKRASRRVDEYAVVFEKRYRLFIYKVMGGVGQRTVQRYKIALGEYPLKRKVCAYVGYLGL